MANTIQIELCKEDRERLDRILEALTRKTTEVGATTQVDAKESRKAKIEAISTKIEGEELPWQEEPKAVEPQFQPKLEDVQKVAMNLCESDQKPLVREIVKKYAPNITAIKPSDYLAVYEELKQARVNLIKGC